MGGKIRIVDVGSSKGYRYQIHTKRGFFSNWVLQNHYSTLEDAQAALPWYRVYIKGPKTVHEEEIDE